MIGEPKSLEILKKLVTMVETDQAEAIMMASSSGLTRFANSTIHQNVFEKDNIIYLKVAKGKKLGVASSNMLDADSLKELARRAVEIADSQVENPHFESFVKSPRAPRREVFSAQTESCTPMQRAENVRQVIDEADKFNFLAAGSHSTSAKELAYVNSLGTQQYHAYTSVFMNTVIMSPTSSGYADASSLDISRFDPRALAVEAVRVCADSQDPKEIPEGRYDVVISPYALNSLMNWLSYIGFGADTYQEGRSFMSERIGRKIMGQNVSIWDDGLDPGGMPFPFDFEGIPRKKVDLIEKGVAKGVVYNSITGHKEKKASTGHALPPGEEIAALPVNLFFSTGTSSEMEMVESLDRGLLVTRFHYINGLLEPRKALFTGMTRDGTFLVEGGKIKHPVKNLRFTHSMLDAFSNVEMISKKAKLQTSEWFGATVVPALKIKGLNFSGKTEF